jgi:CHASE3 domain sensor protein
MKSIEFGFWRWMPVGMSAILIVVVAVISSRTVSELSRDTSAREHTFQALLDTQELEDRLLDAQDGVRRYAETGKPNLLVEYEGDTNTEARDFKELADLMRNNPDQQKRLKTLYAAVQAYFDYDNRVLGVYASQGNDAARKLEDSSEPMDMEDTALKDLEDFSDAEKQVLNKTDSTERHDYHIAGKELVAGTIVATTLLLFAQIAAGREIARRREAEMKQRELIEKLQSALAEVKTLSGLIPICGWCHNVRSDSGFWQTVEQYVHAHTDAKMTHGICPNCAKKMQDEISTSA